VLHDEFLNCSVPGTTGALEMSIVEDLERAVAHIEDPCKRAAELETHIWFESQRINHRMVDLEYKLGWPNVDKDEILKEWIECRDEYDAIYDRITSFEHTILAHRHGGHFSATGHG
jgi:hypothetical protein